MKKINLIITLLALIFMLSCEEESADKISAARDCLNDVTLLNYTTKAESCRELIDGINSAEANRIRCASYFLQEGLTATKMAEAVNSEDETGTSGDPMLAMMGIIGFSNSTRANAAVTACGLSGLKSYQTFAAMGKTAFSMGGGTIEPERILNYGGQDITAGVQCDDSTWISAMEYAKDPESCIASDARPSVQTEMEESARILKETGTDTEKADFADSVLLMEDSKCDADNYADNQDFCDELEDSKVGHDLTTEAGKAAFAAEMLAQFLND